jgi:hypothetical protein
LPEAVLKDDFPTDAALFYFAAAGGESLLSQPQPGSLRGRRQACMQLFGCTEKTSYRNISSSASQKFKPNIADCKDCLVE